MQLNNFPKEKLSQGQFLPMSGTDICEWRAQIPEKNLALAKQSGRGPKLIFSHGFAREQKVKPLSEEGAKDGRIAGVFIR